MGEGKAGTFEKLEDCEKAVDSLKSTLQMAKQNLAVIEDEVESTNALIDEALEAASG